MSVVYERKSPIQRPDHTAYLVGFPIILGVVALAVASVTPSWRCQFPGSPCFFPASSHQATGHREPTCGSLKEAPLDKPAQKNNTSAGCQFASIAGSLDLPEDRQTIAVKQQLLGSVVWRQTQECAANVSECVAETCYSNYLAKLGVSEFHKSAAQALQKAFEKKCNATLLSSAGDGRYLARSSQSCGETTQSIPIEIDDGRISWRHDFRGISFQWNGWIKASGAIEAYVRNGSGFSAVGRFADSDRSVTMVYPNCETPISMRILNKVAD